MSWGYNEETGEFGIFSVWVWDSWAENADFSGVPADTDVTYFRDVPAQIDTLSYADPFGPSTATITFPQITGWDSVDSIPWLKPFTNVDVYFLPCTEDLWHAGESKVLNPLTNTTHLYVHEYAQDGTRVLPIWEGFINTIDPSPTGTTLTCQGALYQIDHYYSKPLSPYRPKRTEEMIARYFDPARRGLWTKPLLIDWDRWTRVYTQWDADRLYEQGGIRFLPTGSELGVVATQDDQYGLALGTPWTTWLTRSTGTWDKALTGYVQSMLATMYAKPDNHREHGEPSSGTDLKDGDQWTITCDPGRQPRMYLRRQNDPPTLVAQYGAPGVECRLSKDGMAGYNVVFAQGTGPDGIAWNELRPLGDHTFITWQPLYPDEAADSLYVGWERNNNLVENYDGYAAVRDRAEGNHIVERYIADFPSGINEAEAHHIAKMWCIRDSDPGWSGTIDLSVDLKDPDGNVRSKWSIRPGDVIHLQGFQGLMTSTYGKNKFHVSAVTSNPMQGTVSLTVDTDYRDLLTIHHAMASGKDTLSVVRSNRTGQMMNQVQDIAAPWSANKGAGVMPTHSHKLWVQNEAYPYTNFTTKYGNRPRDHFKDEFMFRGTGFSGGSQQVVKFLESDPRAKNPTAALSLENTLIGDIKDHGLYIPIQAGAASKNRRWAFFPVLLANAGSIMRSEFACYDVYGNLAPVEYSVTVYFAQVTQTDMPHNPNDTLGGDSAYSALWDGAFEKVRRNGIPWPVGEEQWHWGNDTQQIGWGTFDRPCGYSPGTKDVNNVHPSGMMVDGASWDFNMSGGNNDFNPTASPGDSGYKPQPAAAISMWVAVYVQIPGHEDNGDPDNSTGLNWVYFRGRFFRSINIGSGS